MTIDNLETPALVVDYDIMVRNIRKMGDQAANAGVKIRPHTKTHKCPAIAHLQLRNGAKGITVAKIGEAQVMAESGIDDILIAYPIVGEDKISRLLNLRNWVPRVACTVDSIEGARGLSEAVLNSVVLSGIPLDVYIEVDVGFHRVGLSAGEKAAHFALSIRDLPGIRIRGILTHAGHAHSAETPEQLLSIARSEAESMALTARMLSENGIRVDEVSIGSTPTSYVLDSFAGITEIRPGTYVFNDADLVGLGVVGIDDCALSVLTSVVSRPAPGRVVFDAGSKALSSDKQSKCKIPGHGIVRNYPDIWIERLSEEHAMAQVQPSVTAEWNTDLSAPVAHRIPEIGEKVQIVPNHACPAVNLFDRLVIVKDGVPVSEWSIQGRGKLA
jgi:D-serine deaminase-like pyridoxal phosphate-dependent protein